MPTKSLSIERLPSSLLFLVWFLCDSKTLCICSGVCKAWRSELQSALAWRRLWPTAYRRVALQFEEYVSTQLFKQTKMYTNKAKTLFQVVFNSAITPFIFGTTDRESLLRIKLRLMHAVIEEKTESARLRSFLRIRTFPRLPVEMWRIMAPLSFVCVNEKDSAEFEAIRDEVKKKTDNGSFDHCFYGCGFRLCEDSPKADAISAEMAAERTPIEIKDQIRSEFALVPVLKRLLAMNATGTLPFSFAFAFPKWTAAEGLEMLTWSVRMVIPSTVTQSPYRGVIWKATMQFTEDYPFKAPIFTMDSPFLHVLYDARTKQMCPQFLSMHWSPANAIDKFLRSFLEILENDSLFPTSDRFDGDDDASHNPLVAAYLKDPSEFTQMIRDFVHEHYTV